MSDARTAHLKRAKPAARKAKAAPRSDRNAERATMRIEGLDAWRGVAIVAMIAYHFCFDLRYFGVTRADFEPTRHPNVSQIA